MNTMPYYFAKRPFSTSPIESCVVTCMMQVTTRSRETQGHGPMAHCFTLVQVLIVYSTHLGGNIIEMKPATLAPQDTTVSLKA